jgi:hypothetical protein
MVDINFFDNSMKPPVYIPVTNKQTFDYDVISYYNQYYAPAKVTQNRRIMRNYINNLNATKQYNKNPFMNSKKKYNFLYTYDQNYMIIEDTNKIDIYILINKCWKHQSCITNKNNCQAIKNIIKNNIVRSYYI